MCAIIIERKPSGMFIAEKKISVDMPITTSGSTIGKMLTACTYPLPRKRYHCTPSPAKVPMITEHNAETKAMKMLFQNECHNFSDSIKSAAYHLSEKPDHTIALPSLNENTAIIPSGKNKNNSTKTSTADENHALLIFL